jgi:hypothetical protein
MAEESIKINIRGVAKLQQKFAEMSKDMQPSALIQAAYSANKVLEDAIKVNIEGDGLVDTGTLLKSVTRKKIVYAKDGKIVIITGINRRTKGEKNGKKRVPWRYANALEPKYNFVKDAAKESKDAVVNGFIKKVRTKVNKFNREEDALARAAGGEMQ